MSLFDKISSGEHEEIVWDKNGLLFRKWNDETGDFFPEQMRIIKKTISFTTDNWKTVRTAIGEYHYADPKTGKIVETYGINAETIIGKLILGEELIITNSKGSMEFNDSGLIIDTMSNGGFGFNIKKNGNSVLYADTDGNLVLKGFIYADGGVFNGTVNATGGKFSGNIEANDCTFNNGTFNNGLFKGDVEAKSFSLNQVIDALTDIGGKYGFTVVTGDETDLNNGGVYLGAFYKKGEGEMGSSINGYRLGAGVQIRSAESGYGDVNIYGENICLYPGEPGVDIIGRLNVLVGTTLQGSTYADELIVNNLSVEGEKSRIVNTDDGIFSLHAYETATPYFGDIGIGTINSDGFDVVPINYIFGETVNTNIEYSVFLQKEGQGDLWVDTKDPLFFIVKGTPGLKYSWELKAVQRDYECVELNEYDSVLNLSSNDSEDTEVTNILDDIIRNLDQEEEWIS